MPLHSNTRQVPPSQLREHPEAHLIPAMRPSEWQDFYADIAFRGITVPLEILADGIVLDGRHRLKAALELALPTVPAVDAPLGSDDPTTYMIKAALLRRHLSDDQRAVIAAMWKAEHREKPGPKKDAARRRAAITSDSSPTRAEARDRFNVSRRKIDQATQLLNDEPDLADKVHQGDIALSNARRQVKGVKERQKIANTTPPEGTWQVVVIDPPWPYSIRQSDPTHEISQTYEAMSIDQIATFPLPAAPNSIVWLWVPNAFLHDAFHIIEAWGLKYRTTLTWAKNFPGLGDWLAGQTEHCLLATRGNYKLLRDNESTFLQAPRGKHSEKPDAFYAMVDGLCPGTKIDIFARKEREGWATWGAEAPQ